jgi:predicted PurR-regulated permease PerM/GAF domain-containing protein
MPIPDSPAARPAPGAGLPSLDLRAPSPGRGSGDVVRVAAGLLIAALVIAALYLGREILVPLALAVLLGFVLDPAVTRLRRWGVPRALAVIGVVLVALGVIGGSAAFMTWEVRALSAELPTYQSTIRNKLAGLRETMRGPGMFDGLTKTVDIVQRETEKLASAAHAAGTERPAQLVEVRERPASPVQQAMAIVGRIAGPLVDAGIVLVFVFLVLLDRLDLRDRLVRLMGGSLQRTTDAMDEAGERISRYLIMQLWVNLCYGIPMALGLWLIGVPGAFLWGMLAAVMRYVPYVGPMISAIFPLTLAFAVDPGWSLVLWTLGLIGVLELISNNVVEPWLYGSSTGLSAISLIVAATFWTLMWGPVGLIMSTPLTVCLLVLGRNLPALQFLDVLLGSQPALDGPTRIYQRLLGGDVDEAVELSHQLTDEAGSVPQFYDEVALPVLRMAVSDYQTASTSQHRLRIVTGMESLLDEMRDQHPAAPAATGARPAVLCLGGKWEMDAIAAQMVAHALGLAGTPAAHDAALAADPQALARLDLRGVEAVFVCWFSPEPQVAAKRLCRRLRRHWPELRIVLGLWNAAPADPGAAEALGADAIAPSVVEAVTHVQKLLQTVSHEWQPAPVPDDDAARVALLHASGVLTDPQLQPLFEQTAKRAAAIFDMPAAMVSFIDEELQQVRGFHGELPAPEGSADAPVRYADQLDMPRSHSICGHVVADNRPLVVPDVARDPRFATNPVLAAKGLRFYAGAPLRPKKGAAIGSLCLLDTQPREFSERDAKLLQAMADDLMHEVADRANQPEVAPGAPPVPPEPKPSATVGQVLPASS